MALLLVLRSQIIRFFSVSHGTSTINISGFMKPCSHCAWGVLKCLSSAPTEQTMAPGRPHSEQQRMPTFFKVMIRDFKKRIKIPTEFIKQMRRKPPKKSILRGSNGRTWQVGVKESEDDFFFQNGWSEFVKDYSLETGEFVVFQGVDEFIFDVIVLGHDQCEKEVKDKTKLQPKAKNKRGKEPPPILCKCKYIPGDSNGGLVFNSGSCPYEIRNPHFVAVIKLGCRNARVRIPKTVGREGGLWPGLGDRICVRDPSGRSWPVNLCLHEKRSGRGAFAGGWRKVVKENELVGGDVCIFEIIRKGNPKKPGLVSLHFRRGRQG